MAEQETRLPRVTAARVAGGHFPCLRGITSTSSEYHFHIPPASMRGVARSPYANKSGIKLRRLGSGIGGSVVCFLCNPPLVCDGRARKRARAVFNRPFHLWQRQPVVFTASALCIHSSVHRRDRTACLSSGHEPHVRPVAPQDCAACRSRRQRAVFRQRASGLAARLAVSAGAAKPVP